MACSPHIDDHDSALAYLFGRIDYERADRLPYRSRGLNLDRMRELASRLGDPQHRYPVVHVAGTKGKGSTSAMIAAVLTASGYRTGLYISPHVECVEERLQIDGQRCGGDEFVELLRRVRPVVDSLDRESEVRGNGQPGPTYFEITTAAALLHFASRQVDAAVLEVGLGGRLDSTNICRPEVAVITSISFDHMRQLGHTLAAIAGEKAGIIKPGAPVVTGVTEDEPLAVIRHTAARHGCDCFVVGQHFGYRYRGTHPPEPGTRASANWSHGWSELDYWEDGAGGHGELGQLRTGLMGRHQAANAAVAVATLGRLRQRGWRVTEDSIRSGLACVDMPARIEVLQQRPTVILDSAHNVASARALIEVIGESYPRTAARRRILVFAASQDKDVTAMFRPLLPEFDVAVLTRFQDNPRAADPNELAAKAERVLAEQAVDTCRLLVRDNSSAAWESARSLAADDDLICIAGSFFLASELRHRLRAASS